MRLRFASYVGLNNLLNIENLDGKRGLVCKTKCTRGRY